jgi:DNA-binding NtrC family response regulator
MGKLVITLGSLPLLAVEIGEGRTRIGRSADNDLVLPLPDVADYHAEIHSTGATCEVEAAQGESLGQHGRAIDRARLSPGEQVSLGCYRLQWLTPEVDSDRSQPELDLANLRSHGTKTLEQSRQTGGRVVGLEVMDGAEHGLRRDLEDSVTLIGRSPQCGVVLTDDAVSWEHCALELDGASVRVRDLGSHNGTYLDGRLIESALAEAGSRVQIGQTTLELIGESEVGDGTTSPGLAELIGRAPKMQEVYARIEEAASSRIPVLIVGETGTGKELAARAVHSLGPRSLCPFVPVNCAAIPRDLLEDELFGHVRGAFTGAADDRAGAFERADGGTVFLDEVGELAPELQPKLLRVIEDGIVPRLGGDEVQCDFRVIAATNSDLARAMSDGRFRQDLFYRLAVFQIRLPLLRDRLDDLPDLVDHFLDSAEEHTGIAGAKRIQFGQDALRRLGEHGWPGNVRELRNFVFRSVVEVKQGHVDKQLVDRLFADFITPETMAPSSVASLEETEKEVIRKALQDCNGERRAAARRLGIAESTLYEKIRRYDLAEVGR